jgi:hypothetical protein
MKKQASCWLTYCVFSNDFDPEICANYQNFVKSLGQFVAGDKKLIHFTGNSGDIRLVLSKPDRVGM